MYGSSCKYIFSSLTLALLLSMRPTKILHELPYKEIVNSRTIRIAAEYLLTKYTGEKKEKAVPFGQVGEHNNWMAGTGLEGSDSSATAEGCENTGQEGIGQGQLQGMQ